MKNFLVALITTILLSTNLLGGTRDPFTPDEKYIEYAKDFHYVLSLCGIYEDNSMFCASAVAISPKFILTAAHVVKDVKHCGLNINNSKVVLIEKIIYHDDFNGDFGAGDIAICRLKEPLDLKFYPKLYEDSDEEGKLCCISGYGLSGTFLTGCKEFDGERRAGSNRIDKIHKNLLICTPSKPKQKGMTTLEFIIGKGDSGGGLFIDGKLAGINSCVLAADGKPDSTYTDESGHTRISQYIDWIKENLDSKKE